MHCFDDKKHDNNAKQYRMTDGIAHHSIRQKIKKQPGIAAVVATKHPIIIISNMGSISDPL